MTCPHCGARIMEGADFCVRCGKDINGNGNKKNNTYIVNGQVLDASRTVLDEEDIGKRRKNFLGPIFIITLLVGLGYLIVTYFPVEDIKRIFNRTSDNVAENIALKALTNAKSYYVSLLYENGGESLKGKEFDINILKNDSKVQSGKFVIVDETEYGVELKDVVINGYTCNGGTLTLKCVKIENNDEKNDELIK